MLKKFIYFIAFLIISSDVIFSAEQESKEQESVNTVPEPPVSEEVQKIVNECIINILKKLNETRTGDPIQDEIEERIRKINSGNFQPVLVDLAVNHINDLEKLKTIISSNVNLNECLFNEDVYKCKMTPLRWAIRRSNFNFFRLLIENGAIITAEEKNYLDEQIKFYRSRIHDPSSGNTYIELLKIKDLLAETEIII